MVEEIGKYSLGILKFFFLSKSRKFFCNLIMVERKNDIAQIKEDDFNQAFGQSLSLRNLPFVKGGEK